ncbi:MAG: urease subunit gamma [Actinomycetota bacterium]|nr:urease subunit gamma [Actinomycetota bacterium]
MRLTPTEQDRILLFSAAELARARRRRGRLLNVVEATALVADAVCEAARDGLRLAAAIEAGRSVLTAGDLLPGVTEVVRTVKVEAVFDDGSRLAVVHDPFRLGAGSADAAGTSDAAGTHDAVGTHDAAGSEPSPDGPADVRRIPVTNTSPVPISVTSHFHFFEVNPRLLFDRAAAYGRHLAVPAGTAVRFEPGGTREVALVPIGGRRVVIGFAGLVDGPLDAPDGLDRAMRRVRALGYADTGGTTAAGGAAGLPGDGANR